MGDVAIYLPVDSYVYVHGYVCMYVQRQKIDGDKKLFHAEIIEPFLCLSDGEAIRGGYTVHAKY